MILRRAFLAGAVVGFTALASAAFANELTLITAPDAHQQHSDGELLLVDVRTPGEWAESGIAAGAAAIAMQDPELGPKLMELMEGDKSRPIALICRTGVRSGRVAHAMLSAGFTQVYSVGEGMFGSSAGPGWLARGLPIEQLSAAK